MTSFAARTLGPGISVKMRGFLGSPSSRLAILVDFGGCDDDASVVNVSVEAMARHRRKVVVGTIAGRTRKGGARR